MSGIKIELKLKFCFISRANVASGDFLTIQINFCVKLSDVTAILLHLY